MINRGAAEKASYTIQIFWKGDPGVEDFIIRFSNEAEMNKWRDQVQQQKLKLKDSTRSSGPTVVSETVLTSMEDREKLENPYLLNDDNEDEDGASQGMVNEKSDFVVSRNASSNSLRATGLQSVSTLGRVAPHRFPFPDSHHLPQPLSLNTNIPPGASSPGEFPGNSYFSPSADSPSSTRSSSQAANYPFPRQGTPTSQWSHEENKHKTAPAATGPPSRDGSGPLNAYQMNGRTIMRPSLPVMPANQAAQAAQQLASNNRMRSASTPNIHDPTAPQNIGQGRRYPNGQAQSNIDTVPVPPIPSHMAQMRGQSLNRSQTSSPTNGTAPTRNATQSPIVHQERAKQYPEQNNYSQAHYQRQHPAQPEHRPHGTGGYAPTPITVINSPPIPMHATPDDDIPYPSQLKVKIWFDPAPSHVTIVVPIIIKHRSLIDRIDSKMVKISSASISKGTARLKYKDMDDDFVTIMSDEDVQLAIEDWGQAHEEKLRDGVVSDFELHWEEK